MIGYIEGKLLQMAEDRILVLANQVGYELLLPAFVMTVLKERAIGEDVRLFVYYQQTERQPKPLLIGFLDAKDKEFFQQFISVGDIGPLKAARAMTIPVNEIADAIEARDVARLEQLKGIGPRTAQKMVATLEGKMGGFVSSCRVEQPVVAAAEEIFKQVQVVLVDQLGYRVADARRMMADAVRRNSGIRTPEQLLDEVFRSEAADER